MDRLEAAGARRAMEAAMDGVAVLDDGGRYVYVNREHARLYGYDEPSAMEGTSWRDVYEPGERARVESEVMPEVAAEGEWRGEAVGRRLDGSEFHQELSLSRLDDGGLVCVVRDVTDRKRRERRLAERRAELERQNERLEEFAGTVAHDLRNPLTVARAELDIARASGDDERLDVVESAHERMTQMIAELLSLARRGQAVVDPDPVVLAEVVDRAWRHVATEEAALVRTLDRSATVTADEGRLAELFENLFRNAVEHAGESVAVTVGQLPDGGFYVEDDGPGVPPDERDTVFEAGYTDAPDGTGFGLSIVRQIVDGHGWDLTLTDGREGGARFEVRT
jgi:PAS domain S-box-containing protein